MRAAMNAAACCSDFSDRFYVAKLFETSDIVIGKFRNTGEDSEAVLVMFHTNRGHNSQSLLTCDM